MHGMNYLNKSKQIRSYFYFRIIFLINLFNQRNLSFTKNFFLLTLPLIILLVATLHGKDSEDVYPDDGQDGVYDGATDA
jgi:hypothetical protein